MDGISLAPARAEPSDSATTESDLRRTMWALRLTGLLALVAIGFWAGTRHGREFFATAGTAVLLCGASALVGGLLGLLFGIPKSVSDPAAAAALRLAATSASGKNNESPRPTSPAGTHQNPLPFSTNTNLEQDF